MKQKRKNVWWVKRREDAEVGEDGKKIIKRNKHNREFNPDKHLGQKKG